MQIDPIRFWLVSLLRFDHAYPASRAQLCRRYLSSDTLAERGRHVGVGLPVLGELRGTLQRVTQRQEFDVR